MAAAFQLCVIFAGLYLWYGETGHSSAQTTTGGVSYQTPFPTGAPLTESATGNPVPEPPAPYACPGVFTTSHSCVGQCNGQAWRSSRFCHCDPLCARYGDCCPDYAEICNGEREDHFGDQYEEADGPTNASMTPSTAESTVSLSPNVTSAGGSEVSLVDGSMEDLTKCVQTSDFDPDGHRPRTGHRLVALCPRDWSGDPGVREICQEKAGSDGFAAIPVEGADGRHYKNVYCALCHGLRPGDATFWSVQLKERHPRILSSLNSSQVLSAAKGTNQNANLTRSFGPPGLTEERPPRLETSPLRSCIIVDSTPCTLGDPATEELCNWYTAPIASNGTTYKNLACVRCTAPIIIPLREWCEALMPKSRGTIPFGKLSMATLLIFSDHSSVSDSVNRRGESIGGTSCEDNEMYDPFLNFCRALTCPEGLVLKDGARCARDIETKLTTTTVEMGLTVTGTLHEEDGAQNPNNRRNWREIAHQAASDYASSVSHAEEGHLNITWTCSVDDIVYTAGATCGTGTLFTCKVNVTLVNAETQTNHLVNTNVRTCFHGPFWSHTVHLDYFIISNPCGKLSNVTNRDNERDAGLDSMSHVTYIWDHDAGHFAVAQNDSCKSVSCPLLTFSRDEYNVTGALNDSIRLPQYDRVLQRGEFQQGDDGDVEVCNFLQDVTPVTAELDDLRDLAHFILTVSGSSLSLIGLVVTIVTYVSFPTLRRNAAGKSLMCLIASLFFAQLTMLIGLQRTDVFALCVTFAISSHYFWLSAFFWMNILAIDIYRTFGIGTKISKPSTRSIRYYALYGLGAPALIVCTCAVLSLFDGVDVHYASEHACWIGNGMTNLVSFGVPIVVILCSNAVLFSLTVAGVMQTRRASERMNITQGQGDAAVNRPRTDLALYLKLTTIMGFTWIFGFVASLSGLQFFWYPFIALNSLQGALVCLAFVCNRRVIGMWKARLKGNYGRHTDSNGLTPTRPVKSFQTSMSELSVAGSCTTLTKL